MTGSFEVVADDLTAHASHLDGLVDRLDTALSAANTTMSESAYGLLCAFLPPVVNPTGEQAMDTIKAAGEGVRTTADSVRTAVKSYQGEDHANAQPFARHLADKA